MSAPGDDRSASEPGGMLADASGAVVRASAPAQGPIYVAEPGARAAYDGEAWAADPDAELDEPLTAPEPPRVGGDGGPEPRPGAASESSAAPRAPAESGAATRSGEPGTGRLGSAAASRPETGTNGVSGAVERVRYFEDVTELVVRTIEETAGDDIIGWAHDRIDPDTMGANGLLWYLLKERYGKRYVCYYSKRMTFLMNRSLATNFMPSGVLRRCEQTESLSEIAHKAPLIVVIDATCPEIMSDFNRLLRRSKEIRHKRILFIDHHRKGDVDIEDLPNAVGMRCEHGQASSAMMLHVIRNVGLDLRGTEEGFRLAVIARAGIETDLIGVDPSGYTDSTRDALAYLDSVLGDRGREILDKIRNIKHPLSWYRKLGEALAQVEDCDSHVAVVGLGVIDDSGIVPFVSNRLMEVGTFKTAIVFGIVYDVIEGQIVSVDLDASGRSSQDHEVVLPDLFREVFFVTAPDGRKTSKGGGRSNMLMGEYSGAGASVPLDYWRQLGTKSTDEKIKILHRLAWPAEFLRMRHLLTARLSTLKAEEIRSVVPAPGLEGI